MKKIFLIGTAALGMFFMATSCLDNTEPAGIEAMRTAKAELISAQAAYKAAETAYLTAQQALVEAEAAKMEIENRMREIDLQSKQLDLEMQQAQNEHDIRMLELEYLRQQAEDEARQKELESEIAYYEYLILKSQMDTENLDLLREQALEEHNAKMLELQAATAQAQYDYEMALRDLEALRNGLSAEEQNQLESLTQIVAQWQSQLELAQNALVAADRKLIDAKYTWKSDSTYYTNLYTLQVDGIQSQIEAVQQERESIAEITNSDSWAAKKVETEEEMKLITDQISDLKMQAQAKEADKDPFKAQQNVINLKIDSLDEVIDDLELQIPGTGTGSSALDERASFEIAVPDAIVPYVALTFESIFTDNSENYQDNSALVITSGFEWDAAADEYTLPGGKFVYETTYNNSEVLLNQLSRAIKVLNAPEIATLNSKLTEETEEYNDELTGIKTLYDFYTEIYEKGLAEYNAIAETYGIIDRELDYDNMWRDGSDAYSALQQLPATATDNEIQAQLSIIATEQMLRDSLDNQAVIPYESITLANYKAGTLDLTPLSSYYLSQPYDFTGRDIRYYINPKSTEAEINAYSAMDLWYTASSYLFGVDYLTEPFTPEFVGYGVVFTFKYNYDVNNPFVSMTNIDGADYTSYLNQIQPGYDIDFCYTLLYKELSQSALIENIQSQITNNADYSLLAETVGTEIEAIEEISDGATEDLNALYAELRSLYEQQQELKNQRNSIQSSIDSVDFEIGKICSEDLMNKEVGSVPLSDDYSQVALLMADYNRLENRIYLLNALIRQEGYGNYYISYDIYQYEFDFINMEYRLWDFSDGSYNTYDLTFDKFQEVCATYYEYRINRLNEQLAAAQKRLDRLENSTGDPLEQVIADLEQALTEAQAEYDETLAMFTMWSDKLNALLDLIAGNADETPEA